MSFIRKNWWKFALGFAALILVAFGILWGLGIKNGNISVDDSGVNIKVGNQESISKVFVDEKNLKEFKSVKIKSPSDDISFIPSDCYGLEICEPDYFDEPKWSVENEQLEIQTSNNKSNFGSVKSEKRYINIYYPKNSSFENILVDASSGDINIPDTKAKKLDVSVASGDINAIISDCGEILARNTSGDINIKNTGEISTIIDTETMSGNIKLDGKAWNLLKAKSTSGDVKIIGKLNGQSTAETTSGNIEIDCNGDISNYSYNASATVGSIMINGEQFHKLAKSPNLNNSNSIVANVTSGDVRIDFKK